MDFELEIVFVRKLNLKVSYLHIKYTLQHLSQKLPNKRSRTQ